MGIVSFTLFYLLLQNGMDEFSARNMVLLIMILFENVHIFNARSETNFLHKIAYRNSLLLIFIVFGVQLLHLVSMQIPFMQTILSVEPVSFEMWGLLLGLALGLVLVMETDKWIQLRRGRVK